MVDKEEYSRDPNLISKKEILDKFGISYGQFYRWKRKGLIPESWFLRKSTFTGQETFLPTDKVIERIEKIMQLKEDYSLEEITDLLSPEASETKFNLEELANGLVSQNTVKRFLSITGVEGPYPFGDVIGIVLLQKLTALDLKLDEARLALETLRADPLSLDESESDWTLWLVRKNGGSGVCCIAPKSKVRFDPESKIVAEIDLAKLVEETKLSLRGI